MDITPENDLYLQAGGYMHIFSGDADNLPLVEGHTADCRCHECGREWERVNLESQTQEQKEKP